jgi:hypothetical protein
MVTSQSFSEPMTLDCELHQASLFSIFLSPHMRQSNKSELKVGISCSSGLLELIKQTKKSLSSYKKKLNVSLEGRY